MIDESELKDEVVALALAYHQGEATEEQWARLERLILDEPEAIRWYLRVVDDTITLRDSATAKTKDDWNSTRTVDGRTITVVTCQTKFRRPSTRTAGWWAAAVCLLVATSVVVWAETRPTRPGGSSEAGSARVMSVSNVDWAESSKQYKEWDFVEPGDVLQFDGGLMSLFFSNGAELLIEGPADVTFESLQKVFAREGKLAARVGPGAVGLRIETPHANVIDRGTAFGMSIDAKRGTAVVVHEGFVDLDVLGDKSHPRRRLATGEGLNVSKLGELSRITTVKSADFLEPPQARAWNTDQDRVIESVSDNIRCLETAKFYRIMPRGFREDCRAYVDRYHEWNGLDRGGLPPFLMGGDYVMTFNDDKITTGIEIAVTVSQPAALYVIVDDRVPPPEWLTREFVDTNWDIGSDDGWSEGAITTGFGAGTSVDHVCSVWKREVTAPSTVVLGALSREASTVPPAQILHSMYGIVATPLLRE
jgi:hypothetical protein